MFQVGNHGAARWRDPGGSALLLPCAGLHGLVLPGNRSLEAIYVYVSGSQVCCFA